MYAVEILVDLPLKNSSPIYTYAVPVHLDDQVEYGKRVLVELGKRQVEGFIISNPSSCKEASLKSVLQVLDVMPVFDSCLFELARWISETYICPLSTALKSMIPSVLNRKAGKWVVPISSRGEMESRLTGLGIDRRTDIIDELYRRGDLSFSKLIDLIDQEELQHLIDDGLIEITGKYLPARPVKNGMVYKPACFKEKDIETLEKRASRQAELLKELILKGEMDIDAVNKKYASSSIKSLLDKGYINTSRKAVNETPVYHDLYDEQKRVLEVIKREIGKNEYKEFLLHGVTASGKTEVYLQAIKSCTEMGRNAMVLVPEIALTRHLMGKFISRFKNTVVLHSGMRNSERYEAWQRIKNGEVNLVLGTRSAVFAPISNIGLIVVDEEHENTYKQEDNPKYHACEVARKRAEYDQAVIIYGSATPSVETYYRAMKGEIKLLRLNQRISSLPFPVFYIQDMRKSDSYNVSISQFLENKIRENLDKRGQCILFLNRRGYAPISVCRKCGHVVSCTSCSVGLNYHEDRKKNVCHYCNYEEEVSSRCKMCGGNYVNLSGFGTQKVEKEIIELFPAARTARLDLDSSRIAGAQEEILQKMKNGEIDILIGTQMVAKGLDFPEVALVGIIDADSMINLPDYRAGERAFQLMVQSAGRAGRSDMPGEVVIQTYNPEQELIHLAVENDYETFYCEEIKNRRILNYPPFTSIMRIVVSGMEEQRVKTSADDVVTQINEYIDAKEDYIDILGPAPCPITKLRNRYRYQVILKCNNMLLLRSIGEKILSRGPSKGERIGIEINPMNMI